MVIQRGGSPSTTNNRTAFGLTSISMVRLWCASRSDLALPPGIRLHAPLWSVLPRDRLAGFGSTTCCTAMHNVDAASKCVITLHRHFLLLPICDCFPLGYGITFLLPLSIRHARWVGQPCACCDYCSTYAGTTTATRLGYCTGLHTGVLNSCAVRCKRGSLATATIWPPG